VFVGERWDERAHRCQVRKHGRGRRQREIGEPERAAMPGITMLVVVAAPYLRLRYFVL
jgi:hypothetical protein